jgi:hypothetical protein
MKILVLLTLFLAVQRTTTSSTPSNVMNIPNTLYFKLKSFICNKKIDTIKKLSTVILNTIKNYQILIFGVAIGLQLQSKCNKKMTQI